jgi:hypothetical protein
MEKFCVFCGQAPQEKNREHVIPRWLIEMTGDPKRTARFGITADKPLRMREFSFDAFVFPACAACNTRFGMLEARIKSLLPEILSYKAITAGQFIELLDWLDKIRVGLWLAYLYLDKNMAGITPSFHIESRLGRSDRMVSVIKSDHKLTGVSFLGPTFKTYQLSPTCFAMRINQIWLINAAGVSLCSQRLGFPYAEPAEVKEDHKLEAVLKHGSDRIMNPIERRPQLPRSISIYQPVFRMFVDADQEEFLQSDWLKAHTANRELGYGKLFLQDQDSVQAYPDGTSAAWVPQEAMAGREVLREVPMYVHRRIREDYMNGVRLVSSKQSRKEMRLFGNLANMVDRAVLKNTKESLVELESDIAAES